MEREKAYLVLSGGQVFEGVRIGAKRDSVGELVFTTGMTGYLETLTDPSYAGQIILQTFPMIGNYGLITPDFEGNCFARGYVVRELCTAPSNFRSEGCLEQFLIERDIPGICGVDTRALTRLIREQGVMNAIICAKIPDDLTEIRNYAVRESVALVSGKRIEEAVPDTLEAGTKHIVLIDYGAKRNIIRCLTGRGCRVSLVPHNTPAETVLSLHPDGVMLSNGPGDPADNQYEIAQIKKLVGTVPIFGICLGHQLCALAMGGRTYKLKYGHRGANQPVTNGTRTWITTQNHGYAVDSDSMKGKAIINFWNANDRSCEGLEYPGQRCFTVQFHPEACAGPHDTAFLFDRFLNMIREEA